MKCGNCNRLIKRKYFRKDVKNHFCSIKCKNKFLENRVKTKCGECKKTLTIKKSKFTKQKNNL